MRVSDLVARIGGEEFAVLLPNTPLEEAAIIAEELRESVKNIAFGLQGKQFHVTITFGVTCYTVSDRNPDDLLKRADKLLYKGKENGREQVVADVW